MYDLQKDFISREESNDRWNSKLIYTMNSRWLSNSSPEAWFKDSWDNFCSTKATNFYGHDFWSRMTGVDLPIVCT